MGLADRPNIGRKGHCYLVATVIVTIAGIGAGFTGSQFLATTPISVAAEIGIVSARDNGVRLILPTVITPETVQAMDVPRMPAPAPAAERVQTALLAVPAKLPVPESAPESTPILVAARPEGSISLQVPRQMAAIMRGPEPEAPSATDLTINLSLQKGETLSGVLERAGAGRHDAHNVIQSMKSVVNLRRLHPGQDISVRLASTAPINGAPDLLGLEMGVDVVRSVSVERINEGIFEVTEHVTELETRISGAEGIIDSSVYVAMDREGIPPSTIIGMIRTFSYGIDFQREIQPRDKFEVIWEDMVDDGGTVLMQGDLLYAALDLGSTRHQLYRFKAPSDGTIDYYDERGHSMKQLLMRTPVDGARLTSRYGKRRHPVLGYNKMHKGVDFGASRGTPIMAAGNGTVVFAGRKGDYGNYVKIRHNGTYETAYAHMRGFARGIAKGTRVSQGQTIGYVGSTGRSTGPHLHYEIIVSGKHVNPMSLRLPVGRELSGNDLAAFKRQMTEIDSMRAGAAVLLAGEPVPVISAPPMPADITLGRSPH